MKLIRIELKRLHNEEWFGFFTDFKAQAEAAGTSTLQIDELFQLFLPLYAKADKRLEVLSKSVYTQDLENADKRRDELFRGLHTVVRGLLHQPGEDKQEAARRLSNLLDHYKRLILNSTYVEESAAVYNLLQDLGGAYADEVTLLALTEWVTAIATAEAAFLAIRSQRNAESIDKPKEDLKKIRTEVDTLYRGMADTLNVKLLAAGLGGATLADPDELEEEAGNDGADDDTPPPSGNPVYSFVAAWNETVKKYRNMLAARSGRRAKNAEAVPVAS
jgi:hypothetical protein